MPVMVIQNLDDAVPLAKALVAGGIKVLEITLRTPIALDAIRAISQEVKDAIVGAGTITTPEQLKAAEEAGAVFAISPGLTPTLLAAAKAGKYCPDSRHINLVGTHVGYGVRAGSFQVFPGRSGGWHTDAKIHRRPDSTSDFLSDRRDFA